MTISTAPPEHSHAAAEQAVALVRTGECDALMKGSLHTDELMRAILAPGIGLATGRRMSHVFAMDVPTYPRPLFITDTALNIYPDLEAKRDMVQNAIELAHVLGIEVPKVAILSAVETVSPSIQSTLEATALCKMADRGQITGGVVDGPLAFDNAVSAAAALTKGIVSPVAGQVDILVVPDLESGNIWPSNWSIWPRLRQRALCWGRACRSCSPAALTIPRRTWLPVPSHSSWRTANERRSHDRCHSRAQCWLDQPQVLIIPLNA